MCLFMFVSFFFHSVSFFLPVVKTRFSSLIQVTESRLIDLDRAVHGCSSVPCRAFHTAVWFLVGQCYVMFFIGHDIGLCIIIIIMNDRLYSIGIYIYIDNLV